MNKATQFLRTAFAFTVNFCAAGLITNYFSNDLTHVFPSRTAVGMLYKTYFESAVISLAVGYFVYYKWRSEPAKWVWIAGAFLFVREAFSYWHEQQYSVLAYHSVLTGQPGRPSFLTVALSLFGPVYILRRTVFAFLFTRTLFYSAGAWIRWGESEYGFSLRAIPKRWLHALRAGALSRPTS